MAKRSETISALEVEVARLEAAENIQKAADSAIENLQDKIATLKVRLQPFTLLLGILVLIANDKTSYDTLLKQSSFGSA